MLFVDDYVLQKYKNHLLGWPHMFVLNIFIFAILDLFNYFEGPVDFFVKRIQFGKTFCHFMKRPWL